MALQSDDASVQKCEGETIRMATKIGVNRDRLNLKGILKSTFDNTPSCYIDFNNECTISNELNKSQSHYHNRLDFLSEISGSETLTSRRMERNETDFSEERLRPQLKDRDDSYFIASSSTLRSPTKTSKWIRMEREASKPGSPSATRDYYGEDPAIPNSRNGGKCQTNYSGRLESPSLTRTLIFRLFQLTSVLLIIMGIVTLVTPSIMTPHLAEMLLPNTTQETSDEPVMPPPFDIHLALKEWAGRNRLPLEDGNPLELSILDIPHFHYTLNNHQLCQLSPNSNTSNGIYFVILVHSAPDHFVERQAIRTSWGSVKSFRNWSIRLVFLLGQLTKSHEETSNSAVQEGILSESDLYGDIVRGNFADTYRNLTYKHLMGYKWVLRHCPLAKFVIKTDDDAFIDIFQIFDFAQRNYGLAPADILLCNIYPEGTKPVRNSSTENPEGYKWIVSRTEYPFDIYPKYCGGLGYLTTVDVIRRLSGIGDSLKEFLWIDDVFVTGVIRELAGKEPFYLNLRYSYDEVEYRNWLNDRSPRHRLRKIPYMFVHVTRGPRFDEDMAQLWRKTVRAWS